MKTTRSLVKETNSKYDISNIIKIIDMCVDYLNIENTDGVEIFISPMKRTFEDDYFAFIHQANNTMFVVYIKEKILKQNKVSKFNVNMLLHEMVHLRQYIDGDLSVPGINSTIAIWKGKQYDNSFAYNQRPWEMEAESVSKKGCKEIYRKLKS